MRGLFERNPGRVVELSPGEARDVLDLQWRDDVARVICVTLIGPRATIGGVANPTECVALVQWGAGEAEAEAEIDFGVGGVTFTLPASSIRITAKLEAIESPAEVPPPVRVGAFASVGSGGRTSQLTRTRFLDVPLAVAASAGFEVPPYAKALRVLAGDQATRAFRLDFVADPTLPPLYSIEVLAGTETPLVDLAPDVTSVAITNTGQAAIGTTRAIFSLGI